MYPVKKTITILMADDDPDDRFITKEAFKETGLCNDLHFTEDGEELMNYLYQRGKYCGDTGNAPRPGLILLDLNMPKKDGREALREIKADENLRRIPVVVLTTSETEEDIICTYKLGANSFITKPIAFEEFVTTMYALVNYWSEIAELPDY